MNTTPVSSPAIPLPILTARLAIRVPAVQDAREICAAIQETQTELMPWMPWVHEPITQKSAEESIKTSLVEYASRRDVRLSIHNRDTGEFVGGTGLHRIDWAVPAFEIGYWCRRACMGRGYITEAVAGITKMAFEQLGALRMEIRCPGTNVKSKAVAVRAGYTLECEMLNHRRLLTGALDSTLVYRLLPEEYRQRRD